MINFYMLEPKLPEICTVQNKQYWPPPGCKNISFLLSFIFIFSENSVNHNSQFQQSSGLLSQFLGEQYQPQRRLRWPPLWLTWLLLGFSGALCCVSDGFRILFPS